MKAIIRYFVFSAILLQQATAQTAANPYWHGIERTLHYRPQGNDFLLVNGQRKFNRALYGTNTAFRVEAGDLPEFAMYMPGMGGNCKIGILNGQQSKWLSECDSIQTIYRPGAMLYTIRDKLLNKGSIQLTVLAQADAEGMIVQLISNALPPNTFLLVAYGGATGKKFSRDGDIGADPESSFYLQPGYCKDNLYTLTTNTFHLYYGFTKPLSEEQRYEIQYHPAPTANEKDKPKEMSGIFPANARLQLADAEQQASPLSLQGSSHKAASPIIIATVPITDSVYFALQPTRTKNDTYSDLSILYNKATAAREALVNRVTIETPDPWINPIAGALVVAADAIWEAPSYLHGAVAWRQRLPAWRGPYAADPLGWHDRAREHFSSYALSQVTDSIPPGPVVADTALHLARQLEKMGTALFSEGYIARNPGGDIRPHHYDMNLVYIDELLRHFNWTGDTAYVQQMWPVIKRHLAWEKRNFDADGDHLYDAYACIWASDALQYSGGGVAHASAYNYYANRAAYKICPLIPTEIPKSSDFYLNEYQQIQKALLEKLWIEEKGCVAENKDAMGLQLVHPAAGLWTVYHTIDEDITGGWLNYLQLRYVDHNIPHIPVRAKGLPDSGYYLLSTTNWQPYTWSVNNMVLAENLHMALAYWQDRENDNAFKLWKSALIESMYLGASPGNFEQLSFYDAMRGELYRDFADPIGVAARTLVEGLFGVQPDALKDQLTIEPGFPSSWNYARLKTPDISIDFKREGNTDHYIITQSFPKLLALTLYPQARKDSVLQITVNGEIRTGWPGSKSCIGAPELAIMADPQTKYDIAITWAGNDWERPVIRQQYIIGDTIDFTLSRSKAYETQKKGTGKPIKGYTQTVVHEAVPNIPGYHTLFKQLRQGGTSWTSALEYEVKPATAITPTAKEEQEPSFIVVNNTGQSKYGQAVMNEGDKNHTFSIRILVKANDSTKVRMPYYAVIKGTNHISVRWDDSTVIQQDLVLWNAPATEDHYETINLQSYFNDQVTQVFKNKYLSPRPSSVTLQIPWQGIGNWCYPMADANIDDSGLRAVAAKANNTVYLDKIIPFATPSTTGTKNILFTSRWDNYPIAATVPLNGKASHVYFLVAGTTNHQQSHFTNAKITIQYTDGTTDSLLLNNPENWYPIEQDYYTDGYAFTTGAPKPYRLLLKEGSFTRTINKHTSIKGVTNEAIDGGAATVLDMPLQHDKVLKNITLTTIANEIVAGLMAVTLVR